VRHSPSSYLRLHGFVVMRALWELSASSPRPAFLAAGSLLLAVLWAEGGLKMPNPAKNGRHESFVALEVWVAAEAQRPDLGSSEASWSAVRVLQVQTIRQPFLQDAVLTVRSM